MGVRRIVLDTNVFYGDFRLAKTYMRVLCDNAKRTRDIVSLPAVVIDELKAQYREVLHESLQAMRHSVKRVSRLLNRQIELPIREDAVMGELENYGKWLDEKLRSDGVQVLPYPVTAHERLVRRDLDRRRPFAMDGRGYRDALIWECIREALQSSDEDLIFVSQNVRDFADKDGNLHPELAADLTPACRSRLKFTRDLKRLLAEEMGFGGDVLSEEQKAIVFSPLRVRKWVADSLEGALSQALLDRNQLGFPEQYHAFGLTAIHHVFETSAPAGRRLPSGQILVEVTADVACEFEITVLKSEYEQLPQGHRPKVWSAEPAGLYGIGYVLTPVSVECAFTVDPLGEAITSFEVVRVSC